jgi:cytochrome c biogenesis protein CcdA
MTVHDGVQLLCTAAMVVFAIIARNRLRLNEPKVRVVLGAAGILLGVLIFLGVMQFLPRPWESGFSTLTDSITLIASYAIGGLLVLSIIEIAGGTMQAAKRRRYYRRKGR